jgi:hypothetical protein
VTICQELVSEHQENRHLPLGQACVTELGVNAHGVILTGKIWRKNYGFFKDLPSYSNIPQMEEMAGSLLGALSHHGSEKPCMALLVVSNPRSQILT